MRSESIVRRHVWLAGACVMATMSSVPGWRRLKPCLGCIVAGMWAASVLAAQPAPLDPQTAIQVEALQRLKGLDLESNEALKGAVVRVLEKARGTSQFVEIVRDFGLKGHGQPLLDYALEFPAESSGVEAFRLAVADLGQSAVLSQLDGARGPALAQLIGNSNDKELQAVLRSIVQNTAKPPDLRKAAVRALAGSQEGARFLLDLARAGDLGSDVKFTASSELNRAAWPEIKRDALELLPLPQMQHAEPLPPVAELVRKKGDPQRGREIYQSQTAACSSCHQVAGQGTEVGPNLSEIGTKLGKDALYEAILDPSAGISFGFEGWTIELKNGDEAYGLILSETADQITVKSQTGVVTRYKKDEIERRQKLSTSIMPSGLQLTMSAQDLVDLVEYLSSLKKAAP